MLFNIPKKLVQLDLGSQDLRRIGEVYPCPCCYSYNLNISHKPRGYYVHCDTDGQACGFTVQGFAATTEVLAVASWNSRWLSCIKSRQAACRNIAKGLYK